MNYYTMRTGEGVRRCQQKLVCSCHHQWREKVPARALTACANQQPPCHGLSPPPDRRWIEVESKRGREERGKDTREGREIDREGERERKRAHASARGLTDGAVTITGYRGVAPPISACTKPPGSHPVAYLCPADRQSGSRIQF